MTEDTGTMLERTVATAGLTVSLLLGSLGAPRLDAAETQRQLRQNDPSGDATAAPDATSLRLVRDGDTLRIELALDGTEGLVGPGSLAWVGFVDLDTDGDASTGQRATAGFLTGQETGLGADLVLPLDSFTGTAMSVLSTRDSERLATVPARLEADRLVAEMPAELLPAGTSTVRAHAVVGTAERVTDLVPDLGYVTSGEAVRSAAELRDRFAVDVEWTDYAGATGRGRVAHASDDSVLFWFFDAANWELLLKVLDGCGVNGHYWVYSAATTDVEYRLTVTDTATGTVRTYTNALGERQPFVGDTHAFATCP